MAKKNYKNNKTNLEKENMFLEEALLEFDLVPPSQQFIISNSGNKKNYLRGQFSKIKI